MSTTQTLCRSSAAISRRGSQSSLHTENLPLQSLRPVSVSHPESSRRSSTGTASTDDTCVEPVAHTAIPSTHVAFPQNTTLRIVEWSPKDNTGRKYRRDIWYPKRESLPNFVEVEGMKCEFIKKDPPPGWIAYTCPEGKRLFHNEKKSAVTFTNIYDHDSWRAIESGIDRILARLEDYRQRNDHNIPCDVEICVTIANLESEPVLAYYLASMSLQSIFWLDKVDVEYLTDGERAVVSEEHLGLAAKYQFWNHVELFPCHQVLPRAAVQDLQAVFASGFCDLLTSNTSMFPWDLEKAEKLRECVRDIQPDQVDAHSTFIAARLLSTIYRERFLAFFGEYGARMDRKDSAFEKSIHRQRSWIFYCISPFLFFMPLVYMEEFEKLYVDDTIHYAFWRQFIGELKQDWERSITPVTVLISADVGFLAIGSIDNASSQSHNRNAAQILTYISAVLSLFVFIVCQILMRHHRHHICEQADRALNYVIKREKRLGLPAVAIAFSLPTALFIWSMLTFLAAMMTVFFDGTSSVTRIAISSVLLILLVMVALLLYLERDNTFSTPGSAYMRIYSQSKTKIISWRNTLWGWVWSWRGVGSAENDSCQV
ncbi:hypothetical protein PHLGIDRAFT_369143 [Phlebiopsis gigantea 11061_1 CR5-6]|uniref:WW domain-containing protein n=1 Tax=Phlebiopsis gigantea (strain 11061_1 CR5-6) TaxID=745531 RepID=A0A0C3P2J0_PHLG1|nr:hypothetical protein PHLGIDRAFT_369143 [Phlebiopsis gigantea 11061_1 CR5-6]